MKHLIHRSACLFLFLPLFALSQQKSPFAGPITDVSYKKLGALRNCIGILNDDYILLENNYGGPMDFNNNIISNISCFSAKTGALKSRFNLNELIKDSKKGTSKILVTDVIIWKDKLVAFYTKKNPGGKIFQVDAVLFTTKGVLIKEVENVGFIRHGYENGSFFGQGGMIVNGRNILSVAKEFRFRMSPDSSRILVYTIPEKSEGNIHLLSYDENLTLKDDVSIALPLREKEANLIDFGIDPAGNIFLLVKTMKSKATLKENPEGGSFYMDLFIRDARDKTLRSISITLEQKLVVDANLLVNADGTYCLGTYSHPDSKSAGWIKGSFGIQVNLEDPLESPRYEMALPDKTIASLSPKPKKGDRIDGIPYNFSPYQILSDGQGGEFVVQSSEIMQVQVRGRTGALNTYSEVTRAFYVTHIGNDKKIRWTNAFYLASSNPELSTRLNRPLFFVKNGELAFLDLFQWSPDTKTAVLSIKTFKGETGEYEQSDPKTDFALPKQFWEYGTLEKSMINWKQNEFILTLFKGEIALIRIDPTK